MKNSKLIAALFIIFSVLSSNAQKKNPEGCGTDELHYKQLKDDASYKRNFEKNNLDWKEYNLKKRNIDNTQNRVTQTPKVLNVAFHDITAPNTTANYLSPPGATGSITDYTYILTALNSIFNPTSIQFCLTQKTKDGNPYTLAMSRRNNVTESANVQSSNMQLISGAANSNSLTPTNKNINIYIVDNIADIVSVVPNDVTGFATLPSLHGNQIDGIYIQRNQLVSGSTFNLNMKTLVHEMGHYLGLFHTFGICDLSILLAGGTFSATCSCLNTDCDFNGDMICDTPPNMLIFNSGCTTVYDSCNTDVTEGGQPAIIPDDKANYMDYGDANCHTHFSDGQIDRMHFMLDPVYGPRKSLIGQSACVDCSAISSCDFGITPSTPSLISGTRNEIAQTVSGTPAIVFTRTANNCVGNPTLTYSWTLMNLDTGLAVVTSVSGISYTLPLTLIPGNYQLQLTATYTSNLSVCTETVNYDFVINPIAGTCTFTLPINETDTGWDNEGWYRISFKDKWIVSNGATANVPGQQYFNAGGFDIVPLTAGALTVTDDPNFAGIAMPPEAMNVTKVIRVGEIIEAGNTSIGNAYYVKKTITINKNNCRFKVWYLGGTEGDLNNIQYPFHNLINNNDAAFGLLNRYNYNSPISINPFLNSTIGYNENGNSGGVSPYSKNDMVSMRFPIPQPAYTTNNFHKMTAWHSYVLDYSDFVELNPETEITITLFAHANATSGSGPSLQKAYAYFGFECLGGGMPDNFTFDIDDKVIPCSTTDESATTITIPLPNYMTSHYDYYSGGNNATNFGRVRLYKKVNGEYNTLVSGPTGSYYTISLQASDAPYAEYKMVIETLHKTVIDFFRVFVGYYNSIPPTCFDGGTINSGYYTLINNDGNLNNDVTIAGNSILLCGTSNLPILDLNATCIAPPFSYQWYQGSSIIQGATTEDFQLTSNYYSVNNCQEYTRKTLYADPYCGTMKELNSQTFKIYNLQTLSLNYSQVVESDVCFGQNYTLDLHNVVLNSGNCVLASGNFPLSNTIGSTFFTFQLIDLSNNSQPIGIPISHTLNGPITHSNNFGTLHFSFDNIIPGTDLPYFIPTPANNTINLGLQITGEHMGCTINIMLGTELNPWQSFDYNEAATGGAVSYNCTTNEITSTNPGTTNGGGYLWEYSITGIGTGYLPIPTALNTSSLPTSVITTLTAANPGTIVYIRRKSFGYGHCAADAYSNIVVIGSHEPDIAFNLPSLICNGATAPALNTSSVNEVKGTWFPTTVNNTVSGVQTFTFTPLQGYCLQPYSYSLTVQDVVAPTFTQIAPICAGGSFTLPTTSNNTIIGIWSPLPVNNLATTTYTFTPTVAVCTGPLVTMTVVVHPMQNSNFGTNTIDTSYCAGSTIPPLPTTSTNGIVGTWSPALDNTTTTTYFFTPTPGLCANPTSITIAIVPIPCGLTLSWGSDVSCEEGLEGGVREEIKADIVDGPCIRVCENSNVTYNLNGNYGPIASTTWNITGGSLNPDTTTNTSCSVHWDAGLSGAIQGSVLFTDGSTLSIYKCIEKLNAPIALFGVMPDLTLQEITVCVTSTVYFENLSTSNGGNENLYSNWDFGDGTTSSEDEPSHTFSNEGTYTVSLMVYNGCSCNDKYDMTVIVINSNVPIQCPSVACENEVTSYSVPESIASNCTIAWEVNGGIIVGYDLQNTVINVLWNTIDEDGFGYLTVLPNECFTCPTMIKVPIVKEFGTIKGSATLCETKQGLYSLPKWPTTEFNWSIVNNTTGATLILNTQRNEIIVESILAGTISLHCTYFNTLLNCGGTADFEITVLSTATLVGPSTACSLTNTQYFIQDANGNPATDTVWTVTGPNGFITSGNSNTFAVTFPTIGVYTIDYISAGFCNKSSTINVISRPISPTGITGPTTVCAGVTNVYACSSLPDSSTHWSVDGGYILGSSVGNEVTVIFTPAATIPFQINVWYETSTCASAILHVPITRDTPNMTFTTSQAEACGSTYSNYAIANIQADSYNWTIDPETAGSVQLGQNTNAITILWNQATNLGVQVKVKAQKCGMDYEGLFLVDVIDTPIVNLTGPPSVCAGLGATFSFTLNPSGNPSAPYSYAVWDFGDGDQQNVPYVNSSSLSITHPFPTVLTSITTFTVSVTVYGASGCLMESSDTFDIIVSPSPVIYVSPNNDLSICGSPTASSYIYTVNLQSGFAYTGPVSWHYSATGSGTTFPLLFPLVTTAAIDFTGRPFGYYYAVVANEYTCTDRTRTIRVSDCTGIGTGSSCSAPETIVASETNSGCNSIELTATSVTGSPISMVWNSISLPGAIISNNFPVFSATNVQPGYYEAVAEASYLIGGNICTKKTHVPFRIPYKAGLKYNIDCNNGTYTLQLIDHSVYFVQTPIQQFSFTIDGTNYHPYIGPSGSIAEYTFNLAPGSYTIGIKIKRNGYAECRYTEPLVLPGVPDSNFNFTSPTCQGNAVAFHAQANDPSLHYHWDFAGTAENLQQNPVRVFNGSGNFFVTLKVTNSFGCFTTTTHPVPILPVQMDGILEKNPVSSCEGSTVTLHYNEQGTDNPQSITWYHDTVNSAPIAITSGTGTTLDLHVSQPGLYIAQLTAANNCMVKTIPGISVAFVPLPDAPVITGTSLVCQNERLDLSVPQNSGVEYQWSVNSSPLTQWNGYHEIFQYPTVTGTYLFSVIAKVSDGNDGFCYSPPSLFTVSVVPPPQEPQLAFYVQSCEPYEALVYVTNIQSGANYYWSNGATGTSTLLTHDGPIQARAEINGCTVTGQIDLPIDLQAVAWVFPTGCFQNCDGEPLGFIIGPYGSYAGSSWNQNGVSGVVNSGTVNPFSGVLPGNNFQLFLDNGYCSKVIENLSIQDVYCYKCDIILTVVSVNCIIVNGQPIYEVVINTTNPYGDTFYGSFSAPNDQGFFTPSTITIPPSPATHTLYFYPLNNFSGGTIDIRMLTPLHDLTCTSDFKITFPHCVTNRNTLQDEMVHIEDLLVVAPNPSSNQTTVFYSYFSNPQTGTTQKTIEMVDMLGRKILTLPLTETNGSVTIDTFGIAAGQYLVLMRENDTVIKSVKLIVNH